MTKETGGDAVFVDVEEKWAYGRTHGCKIQTCHTATVVLFMYAWSKELTSMDYCKHELDIGHISVVDWSNFLREVCAADLLANPVVIGGPGTTVEVDESLFSRRKKSPRPCIASEMGVLAEYAEKHENHSCMLSPTDLPVLCYQLFKHQLLRALPLCPICGLHMVE